MKELKGYMMVLGAAVFWGASATAAKFLLNRHVETLLIVQTRVTFASLIMLPLLLRFRPHALRIHPRELWQFALLGIVGVAGSNFTYYFTIRESTVATAILIQYTAPLLVMAYAAFTREERVTAVKILAALLSLGGCFLAVGGYDLALLKITPAGLATGITSIFTFAFMNVYSRHLLARYSFWTVTFYSIASAGVFWLFIQPPWVIAAQSPPPEVWGGLAVLAVISILIPHTLFFSGLRYIVASRAIITSTFEPVVAIVSAALVLGEYLAFGQTVGALLVIGAIILLQVRREENEGVAPETAHAS